jgi:hypothetical protein
MNLKFRHSERTSVGLPVVPAFHTRQIANVCCSRSIRELFHVRYLQLVGHVGRMGKAANYRLKTCWGKAVLFGLHVNTKQELMYCGAYFFLGNHIHLFSSESFLVFGFTLLVLG